MIKNIIFDFDGVLVDSEILAAKAFAKYMKKYDIEIDENEFANFAGKKTIQVIDILSQKYSIKDQEKFFTDIMEIASYIYKNELTAVEGVCNFLHSTKLSLYIGSNSTKDRIISGLHKVELNKYFKSDKIYSFDLVGKAKPDPDIYLKAIVDNNLNKNETVIIEDSVVGVKAGVSAGVKVIGLIAGRHWYEGRNEQELLDAGAFTVTNNYIKVQEIIESN